jgi:hypothetical protein
VIGSWKNNEASKHRYFLMGVEQMMWEEMKKQKYGEM